MAKSSGPPQSLLVKIKYIYSTCANLSTTYGSVEYQIIRSNPLMCCYQESIISNTRVSNNRRLKYLQVCICEKVCVCVKKSGKKIYINLQNFIH